MPWAPIYSSPTARSPCSRTSRIQHCNPPLPHVALRLCMRPRFVRFDRPGTSARTTSTWPRILVVVLPCSRGCMRCVTLFVFAANRSPLQVMDEVVAALDTKKAIHARLAALAWITRCVARSKPSVEISTLTTLAK